MRKIAMLAGFSVFFFSCNKKSANQFSFWSVNGQAYSSNEVIRSETKGGSFLNCGLA